MVRQRVEYCISLEQQQQQKVINYLDLRGALTLCDVHSCILQVAVVFCFVSGSVRVLQDAVDVDVDIDLSTNDDNDKYDETCSEIPSRYFESSVCTYC